jgi:hypothetical protein
MELLKRCITVTKERKSPRRLYLAAEADLNLPVPATESCLQKTAKIAISIQAYEESISVRNLLAYSARRCMR